MNRVNNFLKILKEHFFLKTTISEVVVIVLIVVLILYNFTSERESSRKVPVGDFGPNPYEVHLKAQKEK